MAPHEGTIALTEAPDERRSRHLPSADAQGISDRILDSAETVLRSNGYAGFSTRRVALEAGIALGNLTYHFPTKSRLVRALIDRLMERYLERLEGSLRAPDEGLEYLVRWLLEESVDESAMWLFREIWAMALHDAGVRESIDDFYDSVNGRVTDALLVMHPEVERSRISEIVHFVAILSEGSSVLYGTRRARTTPYPRMIELAVEVVSNIAPDLVRPKQV